jgi:probable rRNA maturation factor
MKTPERKRRRAKGPELTLVVEDARWRGRRTALPLLRRAARLALGQAKGRAFSQLTILLTSDARLKELNHRFRGRKKPTNVLSFSGEKPYLGDIALAFDTIAREARAQGKSFAAHSAHLAAHGVLHLLGHDHERPRDAEVMEALETAIVKQLGFRAPYAAEQKAE